MPDVADIAQYHMEEEQRLMLLQRERSKLRPRHLKVTGWCHNCDQKGLPAEALFCDEECEKDWDAREREARQRARRK